MMTPDERYAKDRVFRMLVDVLEQQIALTQYTPNEIRDAAVLASMHLMERLLERQRGSDVCK